MRLGHEHLKPLALGAAILGSGGGGSTVYQERIVASILDKGHAVEIIGIEELQDTDLVVPIAFMGAPLVALEKMPTGLEAKVLLDALRQAFGSERRLVLMAAEIGGANAFTPLWIGALYQLPVLDADSIGRAFPKLHMSSLNLARIAPCPAFMADSDGNTHTVIAEDAFDLEKKAREVCVKMGSRALVALYIMEAKMAKEAIVVGSLTKAIHMGQDFLTAAHPLQALIDKWEGIHLATGVIESIDYRLEGGFLKGSLSLKREGAPPLILRFINEFLTVEEDEKQVAATPDIITLLEVHTGKPVSTAEIKWGLSVDVVVLPSPSIWKTKAGLELVGVDQHVF